MRETLDGFHGGLQIGGRIITNLRYADDIILLATLEAELQEFVYRVDRVSRKCSLLINVYKTKVLVSDGIACCILIRNELLEHVSTFPYHGSLITEDGECTTEFPTRLNRGLAIGASQQKIWKSHSIPISTKMRLMKTLVWPSNVRLWKLDFQKEWRNASWRFWDEKAEQDSARFVDSKENKWVVS